MPRLYKNFEILEVLDFRVTGNIFVDSKSNLDSHCLALWSQINSTFWTSVSILQNKILNKMSSRVPSKSNSLFILNERSYEHYWFSPQYNLTHSFNEYIFIETYHMAALFNVL